MKKQLTFFTIVLLSSVINAQGVTLNCQQDSLLFPRQILSTDTENLDISADKSEISAKDSYLLTGNAVLNSSEYYLAADTISINKSSKTSNAGGNIRFQDDELMLTGDKAVVKKQGNTSHTTLEKVRYHYPDLKINGRAQKITNDDTQQIFNSASYSLCPLNNTDWQIKADEITLNSSTNRGVAKNVTLEIFGLPVLYTPHYEWALKGRNSGFLLPSFSNYDELANNKGSSYQVRIPYYFNIAPDRDLLITLNQLSSRGSVIEAIYRQLVAETDYWQGGRFEIETHYLNKDDITNNKRWLIDSKLDLSINDKTDVNIKINRASDVNYFKDIAHHSTSESTLHSEINAIYQDEVRDLTLSLFTESEQLINNGAAEYTRAPELSISKGFKGLAGRNSNISLVSTNFEHKDSRNTTGVRTHLQADFKRLISANAYSIAPSLSLSNTHYDLDNTQDQNRTIGTFYIDSKLFLERETTLFNTDLIQTFTPRLAYRYTPEKDQNALPNFDSTQKNASYEALFSTQEFTGVDRIGSANSFTVGLESEFIDEDTGNTYLSLKAGQTFHLDNQGLNINGILTERRKYSNIATALDFRLEHFTFNNTVQFDPENNEVNKTDSAITYSLSPRKFLTLAYHFNGDDNNNKSAEFYAAYPITQKVHVFAGINRSLTDSINNRETTGIAYESCCWALRLASFKEHINGNNYDHVTSIELVLKGFTSTSPNLTKRLEKDIPNYLANLND